MGFLGGSTTPDGEVIGNGGEFHFNEGWFRPDVVFVGGSESGEAESNHILPYPSQIVNSLRSNYQQ
jgi:hypothetical protein